MYVTLWLQNLVVVQRVSRALLRRGVKPAIQLDYHALSLDAGAQIPVHKSARREEGCSK